MKLYLKISACLLCLFFIASCQKNDDSLANDLTATTDPGTEETVEKASVSFELDLIVNESGSFNDTSSRKLAFASSKVVTDPTAFEHNFANVDYEIIATPIQPNGQPHSGTVTTTSVGIYQGISIATIPERFFEVDSVYQFNAERVASSINVAVTSSELLYTANNPFTLIQSGSNAVTLTTTYLQGLLTVNYNSIPGYSIEPSMIPNIVSGRPRELFFSQTTRTRSPDGDYMYTNFNPNGTNAIYFEVTADNVNLGFPDTDGDGIRELSKTFSQTFGNILDGQYLHFDFDFSSSSGVPTFSLSQPAFQGSTSNVTGNNSK